MPYQHHTGFYDPKFQENRRRRDLEDMLGEWYDPVYARAEAAAHTPPARTVGDILSGFLAKTLDPVTLAAMRIRERWHDLIGAPLNRYTEFYAVEDAAAVIEVSHPAFLKEVKRPEVMQCWLAKLHQEFPEAGITALRFVPRGQTARPMQSQDQPSGYSRR